MSIPLIQAVQTRALTSAVASAGTSTLSYLIDLQAQPKTYVPPFPGAGNVNPTQPYTAPASPLGVYEMKNEGGDQVLFTVHLGAVVTGAVAILSLYQIDDISGTNPRLMDKVAYGTARLTTPALTATTDDGKLLQLNVNRPTGRYVKFEVQRTVQNITVNSVVMQIGDLARTPSQQHATVFAQKLAFES